MTTLNQYAISRTLGSTIRYIGQPSFGPLGIVHATAAYLKYVPKGSKKVEFEEAEDLLIVEAFETMRQGRATDRLLSNKKFANQFVIQCRSVGLTGSPTSLKHRLITIRKNPARFRDRGITLKRATVTEPSETIVSRFAHAIEFALVRLRYRHGASIDDILIDDDMGAEFERLASTIAPDVSSEALRLGALYLRKTRNLGRGKVDYGSLDVRRFQRAATNLGVLPRVTVDKIPDELGVIELSEADRYLYISANDNVRVAIDEFVNGDALAGMANHVWKPDPQRIGVRFFAGHEYDGVKIGDWEKKLIAELDPIFNWPVKD